ncbi:MAG: aminotransferase class I/II-fold pyridoxal phosphate-dependent enzyme [Firmicutes bacterium]|nr:aminotransferase class I/II-fold pyridoxal phosphate-dependent enzyme [Bacillota bacterium]
MREEIDKIKALKMYKSQSNFFLVKILDGRITAKELFLRLIKKNVLIRDAENFPFLDETYFRFCILSSKENDILLESLKEIFE